VEDATSSCEEDGDARSSSPEEESPSSREEGHLLSLWLGDATPGIKSFDELKAVDARQMGDQSTVMTVGCQRTLEG
jgi:hypothetical protein